MTAGTSQRARRKGAQGALTLGALGVVFGDIGTSPLYAMREIFAGPHHIGISEESIYGALSLIFWAITIVVSLKYVLFIMRADNHGEGGIMALISLVRTVAMKATSTKSGLVALGVFGAALFYGDALITPAISVLSAVEGLEVAAPRLHEFIIPITLAIITMLFAIQRYGTSFVGKFFGPVMCVWFTTLAVLGVSKLIDEPEVLRAISPTYGIMFFVHHPHTAFLMLGSVVLAVTGAEALYADMGHFGRRPIRRAWFALVFPALVLNYFGQGAMLLESPERAGNPFFMLAPSWAYWPLVILATCAAVIASQAVISGAFSITRQAVRLDFLPLLDVRHTSREEGQVYVSAVNWSLYVAIVALVVGFESSTALASAYGVAVTGTLAIDTILAFVVVRRLWKKPLWMVFAGGFGFLMVDLSFFTANMTKIFHGGWFPLVVASTLFVVLMTWQKGRDLLTSQRRVQEGPLQEFVFQLAKSTKPPVRVPGTAVFLSANEMTTPLGLRFNVEHNRVLHDNVVIFTVETVGLPHVPEDDRLVIDDLRVPDDGIVFIRASFGFLDEPNVPAALQLAVSEGLDIDVDNASYFITRSAVTAAPTGGMAQWRKRLFIAMNRNSGSGTKYFGLPVDRVVSLGATIAI